jgi:hypothetical protein
MNLMMEFPTALITPTEKYTFDMQLSVLLLRAVLVPALAGATTATKEAFWKEHRRRNRDDKLGGHLRVKLQRNPTIQTMMKQSRACSSSSIRIGAHVIVPACA